MEEVQHQSPWLGGGGGKRSVTIAADDVADVVIDKGLRSGPLRRTAEKVVVLLKDEFG